MAVGHILLLLLLLNPVHSSLTQQQLLQLMQVLHGLPLLLQQDAEAGAIDVAQ
jgi:hypothetical protein